MHIECLKKRIDDVHFQRFKFCGFLWLSDSLWWQLQKITMDIDTVNLERGPVEGGLTGFSCSSKKYVW